MSNPYEDAVRDYGATLQAKQKARDAMDALNDQVDIAEAHFGMLCHLAEEAKSNIERLAKESCGV